jgi:hypothetical protein
MFDFSDPETFWLNVTNLALGAVTLICCIIVGFGVVVELVERLIAKIRSTVPADDHAFVVPRLGTTMADGGEREDKKE